MLRPKLKKGQIVAKEEQHGIVILTWRDARDVRMLSTTKNEYFRARSSNSIIESSSASGDVNDTEANDDVANDEDDGNVLPSNPVGRNKEKPRAIHFYNKHKCGIDLSDQMSSYATSLRKGIKWYRKLATEMLLGVSIVNSWIVYKKATRRNIQIRRFRLEIASYLLGIPISNQSITVSVKQHFLEKQTERKNCSKCYSRFASLVGRDEARKKVQKTKFICKNCPECPYMCCDCFNALHKSK